MPSYTSLRAPASIAQAVLPLARLSAEQFAALQEVVRGIRSFSPAKEQLPDISERVGIGSDQFEYMLLAFSVLYSHIHSEQNSKLEYTSAVSCVVSEIGEQGDWTNEQSDSIGKKLNLLLVKEISHEYFRKVERLRAGFQSHAVGFSSIVELRPRYVETEDKSLEIADFIPVMQFRITTDSIEQSTIVFQLTESALAELKKSVDRLSKKIENLRQTNGTRINLVNF